ncbi:DUF1311 domain-containing protein [Ferrimonas sediminicola]|uniref:DUF1311 domain-containing protein n=1 Tax=Ferrimonas sediminicola TaxID=2569538 RepID=A0A4U1BG94_9GAMM|nr:lysozyme inhibitor LprI family protein [Ferrimonas sediminicola]TKB50348.1 DUF1311 domain-containing protein [Ferrimonas sediminicola]
MRTLCLCLALLTLPAASEEIRYSGGYDLCAREATRESDLIGCLEIELDRKTERLLYALEQALARLTPPRQAELEALHRQWIDYRDAKCEFLAHRVSGTGGITDSLKCKVEETLDRALELEEIY